jgi:hypothetical protein
MKWFAGILALVLVVAVGLVVINEVNTIDIPAKAKQIREALEPVNSEAEFLRITAANDLECETRPIPDQTGGTRVVCWWFETTQSYDLIGQFDLVLGGIRTVGTFIGGAKSGAYDVEDGYTGP